MKEMEWESCKLYKGGSELGFLVRKICGNSKILCQLKQSGDNEGTAVKGETKRTEGITSEYLINVPKKIAIYFLLYDV